MRPENLEQDIDLPIRKVVKYLNLLGIETVFSCCGFDYSGQEDHKAHIYGMPQVICKASPRALEIFTNIMEDTKMAGWRAYLEVKDFGTCFTLMFPVHNQLWPDPKMPHFHEPYAIALTKMENKLLEFKDEFQLHVEVIDSNKKLQEQFEYWAYEPTQSWDIVNIPEEEDRKE